jgi:hypothetical protein
MLPASLCLEFRGSGVGKEAEDRGKVGHSEDSRLSLFVPVCIFSFILIVFNCDSVPQCIGRSGYNKRPLVAGASLSPLQSVARSDWRWNTTSTDFVFLGWSIVNG